MQLHLNLLPGSCQKASADLHDDRCCTILTAIAVSVIMTKMTAKRTSLMRMLRIR